MEEPITSWTGLLNAFGVAVVAVTWSLARGAGERARAAVAAFGAAMLALAFASLVRGAAFVMTLLGGGSYGAPHGGILAALVVGGVVAGVVAVGFAHRRAEEAGGDAGSLDVAALAVALALPHTISGWFGSYAFGGESDVTVTRATVHIVTGVTASAALLALVRRPRVQPRAVAGGFALVAVCAAVVPFAPDPFSNEYWAALAHGLAAGLAAAVGLRLLRETAPEDRSLGTVGALAAVVVVALGAWLNGVAASQSVGDFDPADVQGDTFPGSVLTESPPP